MSTEKFAHAYRICVMVLLLAVVGCGGGGGGGVSSAGAGSTSQSAGFAGAAAKAGTDIQPPAAEPGATGAAPVLGACEMFPPSAVFNTRIDDPARFPPHPSSAAWVASVGNGVPFHADWGVSENAAKPETYWGMPINQVDGAAPTTEWPTVAFDFSPSGVSSQVGYPHESDCATAAGNGYSISRNCSVLAPQARRFPFPFAGKTLNENGQCGGPGTCGDHHVLVVEQGACRLWESYSAFNLSNQWYAMSTAAWDLKSLELRPYSWTSGDAGGLPITPLLAKASEAASGEMRHALRVTFKGGLLANAFDWPARHAAGGQAAAGIPYGAVLRLKGDFVIPPDWTPQARAVATAMQRYGAYVADVGENVYVQGEQSAAWDPRAFAQLNSISMEKMEFVNMNSITADPRFSVNSMAAKW